MDDDYIDLTGVDFPSLDDLTINRLNKPPTTNQAPTQILNNQTNSISSFTDPLQTPFNSTKTSIPTRTSSYSTPSQINSDKISSPTINSTTINNLKPSSTPSQTNNNSSTSSHPSTSTLNNSQSKLSSRPTFPSPQQFFKPNTKANSTSSSINSSPINSSQTSTSNSSPTSIPNKMPSNPTNSVTSNTNTKLTPIRSSTLNSFSSRTSPQDNSPTQYKFINERFESTPSKTKIPQPNPVQTTNSSPSKISNSQPLPFSPTFNPQNIPPPDSLNNLLNQSGLHNIFSNSLFEELIEKPSQPPLKMINNSQDKLKSLTLDQNERFKQIKSIFPECETSFLVEKLQACNYDIEKVTRDLIDIGSYPTEPTSLREQHVDLTEILQLFPDIEKNHAMELFLSEKARNDVGALDRVVNILLDSDYPKAQEQVNKIQEQKTEPQKQLNETSQEKVELLETRENSLNEIQTIPTDPSQSQEYQDKMKKYFGNTDWNLDTSPEYNNLATQILLFEFRFVAHSEIQRMYWNNKCRFAQTYKAICDDPKVIKIKTRRPIKQYKGIVWDNIRGKLQFVDNPELFEEYNFIYDLEHPKINKNTSSQEIPLSEQVENLAPIENILPESSDPVQSNGDEIECGCCYVEVPFSEMVQCNDGHLFCKGCLTNYVREAVFGSSKLELVCMASDCPGTFPITQLKIALPDNLIQKYEERMAEDSITKAEVQGLFNCPFCTYAEIFEDEKQTVLECKNPECLKKTCRLCKEPAHPNLSCDQVEKPKDTQARLTIEEKMTQARLRKCYKCSTSFFKVEGCNKMTCRCGALMCYICREAITPKVGYKHFCQHPRDPGKKCQKCSLCWLFTNSEEDDAMAVLEAKKNAENELKTTNPELTDAELKRPIGPPEEELRPKKQKIQVQQINPVNVNILVMNGANALHRRRRR